MALTLETNVFRFDDICLNSDIEQATELTKTLQWRFPGCSVMWVVSLLSTIEKDQRVFPSIWKAYSDYKVFYKVKQMGIPTIPSELEVLTASHGLVHVDHRLLTREAQELSIIVSCSLLNTSIYIPPFNKWNKDTEEICKEQHIHLIKFEDGWRNMKFEKFDSKHYFWYLHHREFTTDELGYWMNRNYELR